jgi:hypothetical protein
MAEHRQRVIVRHATVAALTTLIPVPFLDDVAKRRVERRLVRRLAAMHGVSLTEPEVAILADEEPTPLFKTMARKAALMPVRWVLKKAMVVFTVKAVVDTASGVFHRGFLIDYSLEKRRVGADGDVSAGELRRAVDQVCKDVGTEPVERALSRAYGPSKDALFGLYERIRHGAARAESTPEASGEEAPDIAVDDEEDATLSAIVDRALRRIRELPEATFDDLRQRLDAKLA